MKAMAALGGLPPNGYAGAAELARRIHAPANYLGKLLGKLSRAGLVDGRKGAKGGFRLTHSPDDITLYDVLEPIEDFQRLTRCFMGRTTCGGRNACALHPEWAKVREGYIGFLKQTKLKNIIEQGGGT